MRTCSFCFKKFEDHKSLCHVCKTPARENASYGGLTRLLSEASPKPLQRIVTGPWDICFGPAGCCQECRDAGETTCNHREPNGIVTTSCALIGGLSGAGKSTLSLQLCDAIAGVTNREVLDICSEEDIPEVKLRAERIQIKNFHLIRCLSTLTGTEALAQLDSIIMAHKPAAIILDSVVGLMGKDQEGAVEVAKLLKSYSVKLHAPSLIIDHVTKMDDFAGLEKLKHTVDTTMSLFPSEHDKNIRVLETHKNRFGQAFVSVYLEMTETGLVPVDKGIVEDAIRVKREDREYGGES
jgi:predicted ATP-dependent serine protease